MTTPQLPVDPALPDLRTVRYGPGALMTPANVLTISRLALSPALFLLILRHESSWLTVGVWAVLASTDGLDGWLARRFGTTRSGAFLDPLADKALVLGAMVALVLTGTFWVVPVGLIMVREVAISLFRSLLARQGLAVPARPLAKAKTFVQALAVGAALLPWTADYPMVAVSLLWFAVVLTLVSGAQYLIDGRSAATTLGHRTAHA
jgi:CDP-diacylglycerol--glycerol-3-phosphate 3-phosphatidyltransferase